MPPIELHLAEDGTIYKKNPDNALSFKYSRLSDEDLGMKRTYSVTIKLEEKVRAALLETKPQSQQQQEQEPTPVPTEAITYTNVLAV
jgi:hypothetical protein